MTKLERVIYAAENASEIDLDTRDKLLSVIYESNPVKSAYLKYKGKKTDAKYTKMIEAFENFRIKMANKYGDAWIEKMNKSEEDAYIKAKAIIDTYEDIVTQNCVSKESTNDDYVTERITDEIEADLKKINDEIDKIDIEKTKVIRKFAQKYNIEYSHFTDIGKLKGKLTENERAELDKYNKHISELSNKSNKFMTEIMTIIRNDKSKRINPENPRRRLW